jgi:hypothetical protein
METSGHKHRATRLFAAAFVTLLLLLCSTTETQVAAQGVIRLVPISSGSKVRLIYGKKSVVVNMEEAGETLPGDAPHRYKTLFSTAKDRLLYMLVEVCSGSPISDRNAPCGGDRPCALLWIKADRDLSNREIKSEIYASCSYNYYQVGKVLITGATLRIVYRKGSDERAELTYDNSHPEKGIAVKKSFIDQNL